MLSCYFQEKQRSFTSGDFWVLPRWQVTHFQFLSVFQDGGHVKWSALFNTCRKALGHLMKFTKRSIPYRFGLAG